MRFITYGLMIALTIAFCTTFAWAQETKQETTLKAPEGYVLVEEDVLIVFADAPGEHFHKARESFLKKDINSAADEIRKGAAFMKLEAGRGTKESKEELMASVRELEKLANEVKKGTVTSAKELDHSFARAHLALARHHYLKASESWAKKEAKKVGNDLKASTTHLEHALAWSGHELEAAGLAVTKDAVVVSKKLVEGTGWMAEETGKAIEAIGKEIEKLGKKLEPAKSTPSMKVSTTRQ